METLGSDSKVTDSSSSPGRRQTAPDPRRSREDAGSAKDALEDWGEQAERPQEGGAGKPQESCKKTAGKQSKNEHLRRKIGRRCSNAARRAVEARRWLKP